jgi:signal transduction histidine kinase/uncharacterized protein HemY
MNKLLVVLAFTILFLNGKAQNQTIIDSLLTKSESASATEKPAILNQIAEKYMRTDLEKAESYANEAIILAKNSMNLYEEARGNKIKSSCYLANARYNEAIDAAQEALDIFLKANKTKEAAESYSQLGLINKQRLEYAKALKDYNKAIDMFVISRDSSGMASTYNLMGSLFLKQTNFTEAIKYYQLSLGIRTRMKDTLSMAGSYANIALVYRDQGDFPKALTTLEQAKKIYSELKNEVELANVYNLMGSIYFKKNAYIQAVDLYEKALQIRIELKNSAEIAASYTNLGTVYKEMNNFSKSSEYLLKAFDIRKASGNLKAEALALNNLGSTYWKAKKYNEALTFYLKSLKMSLESNEKTEIASAYFNIGNIYMELSTYDKALKHYSEALSQSSAIDDYPKIAAIYHSMGNAYQKTGKYDDALESFEQALKIRRKLGDITQISATLHNIAGLYTDMGKFNEALKYYNESLELRKKLNDKVSISTSLNALGNLYGAMKNQQKAIEYFEQSLKYAEEVDYTYNIALCSRKLGEIYIETNQPDKALPYFEKSIELGKTMSNYEVLKKGYYGIYTYHLNKGNHKQALDFYILYSNYNDSINESLTNKQLLDIQLNFEMESKKSEVRKQEYEIASLKKEKQFNELRATKNKLTIIILLVAMLFVISLGVLYYNRFQMKAKTAQLLQEKYDIIEQTNIKLKLSEEELRRINKTKDKFFSIMAHDIKNPLGGLVTITDMIKTEFHNLPDNEKLEMFDTINKSSHQLYALLENLLHWSRSQTGRIAFKPVELKLTEVVDINIDLQKANANKKNIMVLNMTNETHKVMGDREMVTLVMRNLLSNAIKFSQENGKITILSERKGDFIEICVEDNGIGISKENLNKLFRIDTQLITPGTQNESGTGLGLILCKEFIAKNSGQIRVESEVGKGSKFIFTLPAKS